MTTPPEHHDTIIIGAGVAGIYQLKRLLDMDTDVLLLEADDDLGGTWYRNRYPGCRFDSESYTYGYSFSKELLDEWHWKERFSSQPENLKYLNYVAEKFGLREHMQFNARVARMVWDESARLWHIHLSSGKTYTSRFVITGLGVLSMPAKPTYPGMDKFQGQSFHSHHWPKEPVSLEGKRVGVVGTGASGVQIISAIADKVAELKVFQRRPNWCSPLNNAPISEEEMDDIRARYDEIFAKCASSAGGFIHQVDHRGFNNFTPEERRAFWDELYDTPGFALLAGNFMEVFLDEAANKELSDYVASRIRGRVNDPALAEKLIPKDHGYGVQRVPLETNYYEVYNRDNVELVDISETPIKAITETGLQTSQPHYDLDLIVYATGFDAITGAYDHIDITGTHGLKLKDKWRDNPLTYLGVMSAGFPNLIMVAGPQGASGSVNFPRAIESCANWITDLLQHAKDNDMTRLESDEEGEREWFQMVVQMHERLLFRTSKSWFTGYNSNVRGDASQTQNTDVRYNVFWGGALIYNTFLTEAQAQGYKRIQMD